MNGIKKMQERKRAENGRLRGSPPTLFDWLYAGDSQVLDLQETPCLLLALRERHLYSDAASGKNDDRPGLAACLQALREGDTLVVWKLDRLGRNLRHLVNGRLTRSVAVTLPVKPASKTRWLTRVEAARLLGPARRRTRGSICRCSS